MTQKLFVQLVAAGDKVVKNADQALWLILAPSKDAPLITLGRDAATEAAAARSAQTWFRDHYRFGRYDHPLTDLVHDVHVYSTAGDSPFVTDAATLGPAFTGDGWATGDIRLEAGQKVLKLGRVIDPVDHSAEISKRMRNGKYPATDERIQEATKTEKDRANGDYNRILKHSWGQYTALGYGFKIYIAYNRPYAQTTVDMLNEKDYEKAWAMRNEKINNAIANKKYVGPDQWGAKDIPVESEPEGDTPDPVAEKPVENKIAGTFLLSYVENNQFTGKTVDLSYLRPGTTLSFYRVDRGRIRDLHWIRMWNPKNEPLMSAILAYVGPLNNGCGFGVSFLKDETTEKAFVS